MPIIPAEAMPFCGKVSCQRGQTAFTVGTQRHKENNCILKASILFQLPLGVDCGCLRGSLSPGEKKHRRRIRAVNELGEFYGQGCYSAVDAVMHSTSCLLSRSY